MCAVPSARYVPLYRGFVPQLASSMTASHHWVERGRRPLLMIHSCPVQVQPTPTQERGCLWQSSSAASVQSIGFRATRHRDKARTPTLLGCQLHIPIHGALEHDVPCPKHRFLDGPLLLANPISLSPSVRFVASGMALGWTSSQASLATYYYYSHCFLFSSTYLFYIPASHR